MSKRQDRIEVLKRRLEHVRRRIAADSRDLTYDRAEASALKWAIEELERPSSADAARLDWLDDTHANLTHELRDGWCVVSEHGVGDPKPTAREAIDAGRALPSAS